MSVWVVLPWLDWPPTQSSGWLSQTEGGGERGKSSRYPFHQMEEMQTFFCRDFQRKVEEFARKERDINEKFESCSVSVTYPDPSEP